MPCCANGGVGQTLPISLLHPRNHGRIKRMLQVKLNVAQFRLVQPGLSHGEMNESAITQRIFVEFGIFQLIGLEVIVEGIEYINLSLKMDIQEILIQIYHFAVNLNHCGENFVEGMIIAKVIQIEKDNAGIAVNSCGNMGTYIALLNHRYVSADFIAHGNAADVRMKQFLQTAAAQNVGVHVKNSGNAFVQQPGAEQPQYGAEGPAPHLQVQSELIALHLNTGFETQQQVDVFLT